MERGWTRRGAEDAKQCRRCGPVAQPILLAYFRHVLTYIGNVVPATSFLFVLYLFLSRVPPRLPSPSLAPLSPRLPASFNNCPMALNIRAAKLSILAFSSSCNYDYELFDRVSFFGYSWSIRRIGNETLTLATWINSRRKIKEEKDIRLFKMLANILRGDEKVDALLRPLGED